MQTYDKDAIKQAAEGRWAEILGSLCNVDSGILDGQHHPCPKCGGTDRFRAHDDFQATGAVLCNQCFSDKNGDGIAAIQWLAGLDFKGTLTRLANFLGVAAKKGRKKKADPFEHLEELPWNKVAAHLWCLKKKPITVDALVRLGAKYCRYRGQYTVIAIPVWGPQLDANPPVGWIMYGSDGGKLPRYKKNAPVKWVKVLLSYGSEQGIVADLDAWKSLAGNKSQTVWKLEGSTDLLTAMSQPDWTGVCFTTANGAKEKPLDWIVESLQGVTFRTCHDADEPGQHGATWVPQTSGRKRAGWCPTLAPVVKDCRNVCLPFPVERTEGPDIRDFFNGGGKFATLLEIAEAADSWSDEPEKQEEYVPRDIDNAEHLAEANLRFYRSEHMRNLVFWRNEWYRYKGKYYEKIDHEHLAVRVRQFIQTYFEKCWKNGEDDRENVRNVTIPLVKNVVESMKSQCFLAPAIELDTWIDGGAKDCIALENKVLSVSELFAGKDESEYLFDHSPQWFSLTCLPYEFDPAMTCNAWEDFLYDVFDGDEEQIDVLQRWFGYLLLQDTSLEKMLYIIGPTRSGKGTITKVMHKLFGSSQIATPTLNGLLDQYAMYGFSGKTIAIIPDARLSRRMDREAITERLLSLVANDPQDVQRKYLNTLPGVRMNLRFTLFSNKLPELDDSSAAMVGRGVYLSMRKSYLGSENLKLLDHLLKELPGILNWAICGRHRLQNDMVLRQPKACEHMVRHMRMNMAPVSQFIEECCVLDFQGNGIESADLYQAWCEWASENAFVTKMNQTDFERRAIDANPSIRSHVQQIAGMNVRKIVGVALKRIESEY